MAKYVFEFTPGLSIGETYDDNINLVSVNKKADFSTNLSPSMAFRLLSQETTLGMRYAPTFVRYSKYDENNTVRHSGSLDFRQNISEYLKLSLMDSYSRSDEPIEETEGSLGFRQRAYGSDTGSVAEPVEGTEGSLGFRQNRRTYSRNTGSAALDYLFGRENTVNLQYSHSLLNNDDEALNDSIAQGTHAGLAYWLDIQNGIKVRAGYTMADFSRDDGLPPQDDYQGMDSGITFIRRFSTFTSGSVSYDFSSRRFDGSQRDYQVNNGSVGVQHQFSQTLSASVNGGYFIRQQEQADNTSGLSYGISLSKTFERGRFNLGGSGGWSEAYQEAEPLGFTRYHGINANLNYQLLEKVTAYGRGSYRQDKQDEKSRQWKTLRGGLGLKWAFHQWVSLSLDYSYSYRNDDIDRYDYTRNQVMLVLSGARLFRW